MAENDYEFMELLARHYRRANFGADAVSVVEDQKETHISHGNLTSISDYCRFLQEQKADDAWPQISPPSPGAVLAPFDQEGHLDFTRDRIIPEWNKRRNNEGWPQFNVWVPACSTGEEAYALAMLFDQTLTQTYNWQWWIEASEADAQKLQKARVGIYSSEVVNRIPQPWIAYYLQKGFGPQTGNYRIRPEAQESVTFRQFNLLESPPPYRESFQMIYCRNILGALSPIDQRAVLHKLWTHLLPGGYLLTAYDDHLIETPAMESSRPATYRKPLSA